MKKMLVHVLLVGCFCLFSVNVLASETERVAFASESLAGFAKIFVPPRPKIIAMRSNIPNPQRSCRRTIPVLKDFAKRRPAKIEVFVNGKKFTLDNSRQAKQFIRKHILRGYAVRGYFEGIDRVRLKNEELAFFGNKAEWLCLGGRTIWERGHWEEYIFFVPR